MLKNRSLKLVTILFITVLLSVTVLSQPTYALISQNTVSWYWNSDTNANSVATGDVNGDGQIEIVTGGYYHDGLRWIAQLQVWNASTLLPEKTVAWNWGGDTQVAAVAIGDVNGDGQVEIVTGGAFFDGTRWIAQLNVFNGSSLVAMKHMEWYWTSNTQVAAVAIGDVNGDGQVEIVTGGAFFDGTRWNSQLIVFNGSSLAVVSVISWYWSSNTYINSVAVGNMTGGTTLSIVTGGAFFDGTRLNSQLIVWNPTPTLSVQNVISWYWTDNTEIASVAIGNLTGGNTLNIITGGTFNDTSRTNSQLIVWGNTLALQRFTSWYTTSNTKIGSVAVGNYSGGSSLDIIIGGTFSDGVRDNAQLIDLSSADLSLKSTTSWQVTSNTENNAVAIGNVTGSGNRVVTGGSFFDGLQSNAQIIIWT
jgi:hypothetical protein